MTHDRASPLSRRDFLILSAAVAASTRATYAKAASPSRPSPADPASQIWFVRHAESEIDLPEGPGRIPDEGITYPLTRTGIEQARALAESLASTPIVAIHSSIRLRAIQTADALALQHRLAPLLAPEAVEIDLGTPPRRNAYASLRRQWFEDKNLDARRNAGESFADLQRRFLPFVREIMNRQADRSGIVVIVSHGVTLGLMIPVLADNVPINLPLHHPLPNTGIIKTELRDSRLMCTEWAGISARYFDTRSA